MVSPFKRITNYSLSQKLIPRNKFLVFFSHILETLAIVIHILHQCNHSEHNILLFFIHFTLHQIILCIVPFFFCFNDFIVCHHGDNKNLDCSHVFVIVSKYPVVISCASHFFLLRIMFFRIISRGWIKGANQLVRAHFVNLFPSLHSGT